jgi:hypothetical protein
MSVEHPNNPTGVIDKIYATATLASPRRARDTWYILAAKEHNMPRLLLAAFISASLLSACAGPPPAPMIDGRHSESVGFTGIGPYNN